LIGLEFEEQDQAFFLTFKGNRGLYYSAMYLENPHRLVIDVQGVKLDFPLAELENLELNHQFVIRETNMPSILVETAFISNPTEEKLLADPAFRARIAMGIAEGIERYFNQFSF